MLSISDPGLFRQQAFIGGAWVDADSGRVFEVNDPATGLVLGTVPALGAVETRRAIESAAEAWPAWRARTAQDRSAVLRRLFDLVMAHQEDLAQLMTAEQGKPLAEARGEIQYAASFLEWFAEEAKPTPRPC